MLFPLSKLNWHVLTKKSIDNTVYITIFTALGSIYFLLALDINKTLQHEWTMRPLTMFLFVSKCSVDFKSFSLSQHLVVFTGSAPQGTFARAQGSSCGCCLTQCLLRVCTLKWKQISRKSEHTIEPPKRKYQRCPISKKALLYFCSLHLRRTVGAQFEMWLSKCEKVCVCVSGQKRAEAGLFLIQPEVQKQAHFCNLIFHCLHIWSCM